MRKERTKLFKEMQFDDVLFAQKTLEECETKLNRNKLGLIVASLVPVFDAIIAIIFSNLGLDDSLFYVFLAAAVVAYLIGGGLGTALKMVWNVTMFGFWFIPIFPVDLIVGLTALSITGAVALFLPIGIVFLTRMQINKDKKAAEQYLACCKPVNTTETVTEETVAG